MTKYYVCLAAITLLALVASAEAQVREQSRTWRTFEVPGVWNENPISGERLHSGRPACNGAWAAA
jgi:hypothetical protein